LRKSFNRKALWGFEKVAATQVKTSVLYSCFYIAHHFKTRHMELTSLLHSLQCPLPEADQRQIQQQLEAYINYLITNDFNRLVQLLYTVDVDEQKLKVILQQQPHKDAAAIIAELLLARQLQKAETRRQFSQAGAYDEDERW
jgi:hypothetical protein